MKFGPPMEGSIYLSGRDFYYQSSIYYGGQHAALDLGRTDGPTDGAKLLATAPGLFVPFPYMDSLHGYNGYIDHGEENGVRWRSGYSHMKYQPGPQRMVDRGDVIGICDNTGLSLGSHLHFDLWASHPQSPHVFAKLGWFAHDPMEFIDWNYTGEEEQDFLMALTDAEQRRILAFVDYMTTPRQYGPEWYNRKAPPLSMIEMAVAYLDGVHLGTLLSHTLNGYFAIAPTGGTVWYVYIEGNVLFKRGVPDIPTFVAMGGTWGAWQTRPQAMLDGITEKSGVQA
jgi:hypothetical protein